MTTQETITELNGLITTCRDGELGYVTAAADVRNAELESIFKSYAAQRRQFVGDLQAEVKRLGGDPENSGSVGGTLLCGWMDVKSALSGDTVGPIIANCETGEEAAVAAFEWVVSLDVPGETRSLVEKQWNSSKQTQASLRRLTADAAAGIKFQANDK